MVIHRLANIKSILVYINKNMDH